MSTSSSWPRKRSETSAQDAKWTSAGAAGGKIISTLVSRCSGKSALEKVEEVLGPASFSRNYLCSIASVVSRDINPNWSWAESRSGFSLLQSIAGYRLSRHSPLVCAIAQTVPAHRRPLFRGFWRLFAPIQTPKFVILRRPLANPSVIPPLQPLHKVRIQSLKAGAWCYI
jgi:hypothetical protein